MSHKGRKFQVTLGDVGRRRRVPYFNLSPQAYCKVSARRRKGERRDFATKGKVVEDNAAGDVGEDCATVLVDGQQKVAARVQCEAGDVLAMRKGEGV